MIHFCIGAIFVLIDNIGNEDVSLFLKGGCVTFVIFEIAPLRITCESCVHKDSCSVRAHSRALGFSCVH